MAINLFHQQFLLSIREGNAGQRALTLVLSALVHLDPFQVTGAGKWVFLWITEILNSKYPEDERYRMASQVVQLLGNHFCSMDPEHPLDVQPAWIPPLLDFLLLCEKFYTTDSPPYPGSTALYILSNSPGSAHLNTTILPILTSTLSPTHPLQSRSSALKAFHRFIPGWFSSQMENIPEKDLDELLQAVGDPFQFTSDPPLDDRQPMDAANYNPMLAVVVLIGFASSDLWRNHLRRSNFTSCEEIVSTEEGLRTAFRSMTDTAAHVLPEFLSNPSKVTAAIRRLEELQCSSTAGVVAAWAQTAGASGGQDLEHPRGYTTRKEGVGVEEGDKAMDIRLGRFVAVTRSMDHGCHYPQN